jgi:hypothetical protein
MGSQVSVEITAKRTPPTTQQEAFDEKKSLKLPAISNLSILDTHDGDDSPSLTQDTLAKWSSDFEAVRLLTLT